MPPAVDPPFPPDASRPALGPEHAQLEAVMRHLPVGVLIAAAPDGRVVSGNARAREIFGVDSQGATIADYAAHWRGVGADGRRYAGDELPLARAIRRGEVVSAERIVFERPDGSHVTTDVTAAPVRDTDGQVTAGVAVIEDVTARVAAEQAERAAASRAVRLQRVTAALAEPLTREQVADVFASELPDALGTVYAWLAAVSADGRRFEVLVARDRRDVVSDAWDPIPTDGDTVVASVYRDGQPRCYGSRAALLGAHPQLAAVLPPGHEAALALPLRNDSRVLAVAWLAFAEPRTFPAEELQFAEALAAQCASALERARLYQEERALRAEAERQRAVAESAQREAEQASRAKGEFLATMSHELRTPLNAIAGYAQLLDLEVAGPLTAQQRDYLTRLSASGRHLLGLVNDVLDLARLDAGHVVVARDTLRLSTAMAAVFSVVLPLAEAKRVRLVDATAPDADAGYVGDEHRVRQVLINLLSNAVKFTPPGGRVELACERRDGPAAGRHVEGTGPWLAVTVRDTGIGIAAERQGAVFEPFVQAEAGHTRQHDGTGLGLTISRRLARLMGGDITLDSAPDAGATFTLWLPVPPGDAVTVTSELAIPGEVLAAREGRARREVAGYRVHGLREIADHLREHIDEIVDRYLDRLRRDAITGPAASGRSRADLEDHNLSFIGDLLQALGILGDGVESERLMLQDGADVQRLLSERHGRQRQRLEFSAEQLAREYALLGQELTAVVRQHVPEGAGDVQTALATLERLVRRSAEHAARGHRRAMLEATGEHAAPGRPSRPPG